MKGIFSRNCQRNFYQMQIKIVWINYVPFSVYSFRKGTDFKEPVFRHDVQTVDRQGVLLGEFKETSYRKDR